MPAHHEKQISPYHTQQLFDLVADIERYPEFLPWCRAARVLERREGEMLAELVIAFGALSERYTSQVALKRPPAPDAPGGIDVAMTKGPFEYLTNRWRFEPRPKGGTIIEFSLDFQFRSRWLEALIGPLFGRATDKMAAAFAARAEALYGAKGNS